MRIFGFGFQLHNVSSRTLYQIEGFEHRTLLWGVKSIDKYLEKLLKDQPQYILGLGIYTGKGKDYLHLETETVNQFKKSKIDDVIQDKLNINPFLKESEKLKFTNTIGTSFCNYVSWKIVSEIQKGKLKSEYSFVHIPKSFEASMSGTVIQDQLDNLS